MERFIQFASWMFVNLAVGTLLYIGGRILLPEMGLTAPDWNVWFWASVLVITPILYGCIILQASIMRISRRFF